MFCKRSETEMTTLSSTDNTQRSLSSSLAENVAYHYVNLILVLIKYLKDVGFVLPFYEGGVS